MPESNQHSDFDVVRRALWTRKTRDVDLAEQALSRLVEQLEASQRRVAQLELDVDRLSRAFDTGNA